jgi:endoglucanase
MDVKKLLFEFSALTGVAGREAAVAAFGAELLRPYGETEITPIGSVLCRVKKPKDKGAHILLDAHMDEIGMIVSHINEKGFLRVGNCGLVDRRALLASQVTVHTANGPLQGVVCSIPPHLADNGEKKNPKVDEIWIDIGFDGEAAKNKVMPGDAVSFDSNQRELLGGAVSGKALDDRAGCVSLLCALEYIGSAALDCGVSVLFSSIEEGGGWGAKTGAYIADPTHAIAVDVTFAHTPDSKKENTSVMNGGPVVCYSSLMNKGMCDDLIAVAKEKGIPFQIEATGGHTGTNADLIATVRAGVRTALVSIPQKYMHTPIEVLTVADVENTGRLIAEYIKKTWGKV